MFLNNVQRIVIFVLNKSRGSGDDGSSGSSRVNLVDLLGWILASSLIECRGLTYFLLDSVHSGVEGLEIGPESDD